MNMSPISVVSLSDMCGKIFAGGDVPKGNCSKYKTDEYSVPIFANGEKNKGLYGYTNIEKVTKPSITVSARGTIGYSEIRHEPFFPIVRLIVLTPDLDIVNLEFLKYIVLSMDFINSGSSIPQLTVPMIKDYKSPLPPIPEQKRIVAILDQVFADIEQTRAKTEQNLKNARELFESYLQQVFSQRGEGWVTKPLENFSTIVNGYAFKSGDFSPKNDVKSIKITNVGVYEFVEESDNYLPKEYIEKYNRYRAYEGDVVVALTRTIISSGLKVAIVPANYDGALINQRVAAVNVNEEVMPKDMLQSFLSTKMAIDYVRSNVNELMQPNLSIKDLKAFPVPVPPVGQRLAVSKRIAEIKEQTEKLVSVYTTKLNALTELKKSILQKAFSGELTRADKKSESQGVAA